MANIVFTEGSGLQDSIYGKCLYPLRMVIESQAEAFEQQSILPLLFNMEKSDRFAEQLTGMTSMAGPKPVGEGGDYVKDGFQEGYSSVFQHCTWKDEFEVTEEMVDDNRIIQLKSAPTAFTKAWARKRETHGAELFGAAIKGAAAQTVGSFVDGGFTFTTQAADKQNLFATGHTSKTGGYGTQSNVFVDAFSGDALAAMECAMQDFRDDNGVVLDVSPKTIVIPNDYALKKSVFATIGADKDPETANNGANFLFGRWNVIIWPYLNQFLGTDKKPWILLDPDYNKVNYGSVWFDRKPLTIKQKIADNDNLIHKGKARWSAGFHDWRAFAVGGVTNGSTLIA
jgi:hypothetical protein